MAIHPTEPDPLKPRVYKCGDGCPTWFVRIGDRITEWPSWKAAMLRVLAESWPES